MNLLTNDQKKEIASSTLSDWKKRDLSTIVGYDENDPFFETYQLGKRIKDIPALEKANEAVLSVCDFYKSILANLRGKRRIWNEHKNEIISLIKIISPVFGVTRSCEFLQISVQRFYRWSREISCPSSVLNLCRKNHPNQLTLEEQKSIENYLRKPEFIHWPLRSVFYQMLRDGIAFMNLTTFYKYARSFNVARYVRRKPKQRTGIRSDAPLKLLHMDTTIIRTLDNLRVVFILSRTTFPERFLAGRLP